MAAEEHEFTGKTVEEATDEGLAQLGLRADQADIEILSRGSRGIFGIGSEPARVRIARRTTQPAATAPAISQTTSVASGATPTDTSTGTPTGTPAPTQQPLSERTTPTGETGRVDSPPTRTVPRDSDIGQEETEETGDDDWQDQSPSDDKHVADKQVAVDDDELIELSQSILAELVQRMGFECDITAAWKDPSDDESERYLHLDIHGKDLGALIGRRGETLASIQYLVRLMVNQRIRQWKPIVVDVENYKERRITQLTQLAQRMAGQVIETGRAISLEPMPASERRIVHLTLRDHPEVYTQSSGEGDRRKVHIVARE